MSGKKKETRGRPTKINDALKAKLVSLFEEGRTEEEAARIVGIHVNTLRNWKHQHPDFLWSVNEAKEIADDLVESALFTRAVGFQHQAVKIMSYEGVSFEHKYTEIVAPDTSAAVFWLKNRRPDKWRDKQEIETKQEIKQGFTIEFVRDDKKED